MVTKESSGDKDSPICHVRVYSEKIKSRGFYIDSFLLKMAPHTTELQWTVFFFVFLKNRYVKCNTCSITPGSILLLMLEY